jgi:hypothetical protein
MEMTLQCCTISVDAPVGKSASASLISAELKDVLVLQNPTDVYFWHATGVLKVLVNVCSKGMADMVP